MVKKRDVGMKHLINRLNHLHFNDSSIIVNLAHAKYKTTVSLRAKPLPCLDGYLECVWLDAPAVTHKLQTYTYLNFIAPDPRQPLLVEARLISISAEGISFQLPDVCHEIGSRRITRHSCEDVQVRCVQNGILFRGRLLDFSPVSFRLEIRNESPSSFHWINPEIPVHLIFEKGGEVLYSGDCRVVRQDNGQRVRTLVVAPEGNRIRRFRPKEFRSSRHTLVPSPNVIFYDPLSGKMVNLKTVDLSGSGFAVEEDEETSVLVPGKIIPEVQIDFANVTVFTCRAQVIYRNARKEPDGNVTIRCGLVILDMDIRDHVRLLALLHQAADQNTYVCNRVNLESLWDLFFETGFLYPRKYAFLQAHRDQFRDTYARLYTQNPHIARHFVYQKDGTILGHIAMVRFYENTWLIHHHAARKSVMTGAGLVVLEQLSRSIIDTRNLLSAHMNFLISYFRPDNKFPSRVFGAFAKELNDPKGCSVDTFAYFHFRKRAPADWGVSGPWELVKTDRNDLEELEDFYRHESGGLMIHALDLAPDMLGAETLTGEYRKIGFKKERRLYSVKKSGMLKAVIMADVSDTGLNMSDLTNSLKVFIVDGDGFRGDTFSMILSLVSAKFEGEEVPVLVYPYSYLDRNAIPYEKLYTLFAIDTQYSDDYFRHLTWMKRFAKRAC
ncbi:MAG: PilZ domain-containing protein [Geobacteraceae bacterium]|nr:PilZ domain-containing protein [Geobacteraceae bacterium]